MYEAVIGYLCFIENRLDIEIDWVSLGNHNTEAKQQLADNLDQTVTCIEFRFHLHFDNSRVNSGYEWYTGQRVNQLVYGYQGRYSSFLLSILVYDLSLSIAAMPSLHEPF